MNVLVACECSQRVCKAFRDKGHNAFSCDIQKSRGGYPEWHIPYSAIELLSQKSYYGFDFYTEDYKIHEVDKWDLIIAHPPCVYLTKASAVRMYTSPGVIDEKRFKKAMKAKEFFMFFYNFPCDRMVIENPVPLKCVGLPPYTQIVQPYEHGDPFSKATCLWLKGVEPLVPSEILIEFTHFIPSNCSKNKGTSYNSNKARGFSRSLTFSGIARAMADQWG